MEWISALALLVGGLFLLMFLGMPVAVAFLGVNILGVMIFMGGLAGIDQLIANATDSVTTFALLPVPLFTLMGELLFHSGLAVRIFDALDLCFGRIKGRLSYLTVAGGTLFATLSGSSMANTAMLGSTLMPEMLKRGYKPHVIMGPIIATGSVAMIIPPSSLAVLLGSLARIDVGSLLIAGLLPGLLLMAMYVAVIRVSLFLDPDAAPSYDVAPTVGRDILRAMVFNVAPMGLVVFCVIGLILLGWATPTESAAFGALSVLLLVICYGKLNRTVITKSFMGTLKVSAMMLMILIGSTTFSQVLAFSGASSGLIGLVSSYDLGWWALLGGILMVLIVLGMFMDQLSIMMLTLPIFLPLVMMQGLDPIWFGVIMLLALEMSLSTPPFGLLLFVMAGVAPKGTSIWKIAKASLPYLGCTLLMILLLAIWPGLATWLPNFIRN